MPALKLEVGDIYRNSRGTAVLIVDTIDPASRAYRNGLRFIDHRGWRYTETGVARGNTFGNRNLVELVEENEENDAVVQKVIRELQIKNGVYKTARAVLGVGSLSSIVRGALMATTQPGAAAMNLAMGFSGLIVTANTPRDLYNFK